jgi:hypothetical protein
LHNTAVCALKSFAFETNIQYLDILCGAGGASKSNTYVFITRAKSYQPACQVNLKARVIPHKSKYPVKLLLFDFFFTYFLVDIELY